MEVRVTQSYTAVVTICRPSSYGRGSALGQNLIWSLRLLQLIWVQSPWREVRSGKLPQVCMIRREFWNVDHSSASTADESRWHFSRMFTRTRSNCDT